MKTMKSIVAVFMSLLMTVSIIIGCIINTNALTIGTLGRISSGMPINGLVYNIRSMVESRYVDVLSGGTNNGADVWTYQYNGASCQEWRIELVEGTIDEYMIMDINSEKYLSIDASSSTLNANAWIWENDGTTGQRFRIVNVAGGIYQFLTKCSGYNYALGVDSATYDVRQISPSSVNTHFYLELASYSKGVHDGEALMQNQASDFFANMEGTVATQSEINNSIIKCNVRYIGNGYYNLFMNENKYLTVNGVSPSNGETVRLQSYDKNNEGQKWKLIYSSGVCQFQPKSDINSSLVLCSQDSIVNSNLVVKSSSSISGAYSFWRLITINNDYSSYGLYSASFSDATHTESHFRWINDTVSNLYDQYPTLFSRMGLNAMQYEALQSSSMMKNIQKSSVSIIWTHGDVEDGEAYLRLNPKNALNQYVGQPEIQLFASTYKNMLIEYAPDDEVYVASNSNMFDFSGVNCIVFAACHSAHNMYTDPTTTNFLTASVYGGVSFAIGFDSRVNCDYLHSFLDNFFEQYEITNSYLTAFKLAVQNTSDSSMYLPYLLTSSYRVYYDGTQLDDVNVNYY